MTTKLEQAARHVFDAWNHGSPLDTEMAALEEALDHSADSGNKVSDHIADAGKVILTTDKTTEALKLAEEAFTQAILKMQKQDWKSNYPSELKRSQKALATIRAARAREQAGQEPVTLDEARRIAAEYSEPNSQVDSGNLYWALCEALKYAAPQPVQQEPVAGERCIIVESCKRCPHSFGRQSCALAERDFDEPLKRSTTPPMWCPLPLYAAPVQQVEQEPEVWYCPDCGTLSETQVKCCPDWIRSRKVTKNFAITCKATFDRNGQAEQSQLADASLEPVAIDGLARACNLAGIDYKDFLRIKAYLPIAAPVRTKDLTDDELFYAIGLNKTIHTMMTATEIGRAAIAADRKLNGVEK